MRPKLVDIRGFRKRTLQKRAQKAKDARYRTRVLIVLSLGAGKSTVSTSRRLSVARATVSRVAKRFREEGMAGLIDHRACNGSSKMTIEAYILLEQLLACSPQDFGWLRPTWTRKLFSLELEQRIGLKLSTTQVGNVLRSMGARYKRARPVVVCPWPRRKRLLYIASLHRLVKSVPAGEAVFWVDEMDIHLNPKMGPDWMFKGTQTRVLTPGKNKKAYLAGALNAKTGELDWYYAERKNSDLFIGLCQFLVNTHPELTKIHLIADNATIHHSKITCKAISKLMIPVELHFLPPYCSPDNPIERVWLQLHANVTRNHKCRTLDELIYQIEAAMEALSPFPGSQVSTRRAS